MQRSRSLNSTCRRAFTLVEILIVLAIIGILAAILLPVFSNVRETARSATCASNLKQIHLAFQMYLSDNNRRYPSPVYASLPQEPFRQWPVFVEKYVGALKVFECPSNPDSEYRSGSPAIVENGLLHRWSGSYSMADLRGPGRSVFTSVSESLVRSPSETALVVDCGIGLWGGVISFCDAPDCLSRPATEDSFDGSGLPALPVHRDRKNLLFMDGHVKAMTQAQLYQPKLWAF